MGDLANFATKTAPQARERFGQLMTLCQQERTKRLGEKLGSQINDLVKFLIQRTSWMTAPASTKYHLCVDGGLVIHSVNVTECAIKLRDCLMPEIPIDSVILCAMLHDGGKIYSQSNPDGTVAPRYQINTGSSRGQYPYTYTKGGNEIALTIKDLLIPFKFVDMSDAEMQAILFADGMYVDVNKSLAHNETPLACIIHWADFWEGHVVEGNIGPDWLKNIYSR
jgi:23S rRNA maturation-related 3'-5' exoribonuclease YhaM